jgi:hypothetical protein
MKEPVNVVRIENNCLSENKLFTGKNAVKKAQKFFIKCLENLGFEDGDSVIDAALDNGYYEAPLYTICISEPEVIK